MSLYGEFHVPAEAFALQHTLEAMPETVIETERIVATDTGLTPYFWIDSDDVTRFERVTEDDPSIEDLRRLDVFDRATLYRAEWTERVDALVFAYTQIGATILEASGQYDEWELKMRFDDRERFGKFQRYCADADISFRLTRLQELTVPQTGCSYGLTPKQHEALATAWEMGYFRSSDVTLEDVAEELEITQQSLSDRLHRGYHSLIANTIQVTPP